MSRIRAAPRTAMVGATAVAMALLLSLLLTCALPGAHAQGPMNFARRIFRSPDLNFDAVVTLTGRMLYYTENPQRIQVYERNTTAITNNLGFFSPCSFPWQISRLAAASSGSRNLLSVVCTNMANVQHLLLSSSTSAPMSWYTHWNDTSQYSVNALTLTAEVLAISEVQLPAWSTSRIRLVDVAAGLTPSLATVPTPALAATRNQSSVMNARIFAGRAGGTGPLLVVAYVPGTMGGQPEYHHIYMVQNTGPNTWSAASVALGQPNWWNNQAALWVSHDFAKLYVSVPQIGGVQLKTFTIQTTLPFPPNGTITAGPGQIAVNNPNGDMNPVCLMSAVAGGGVLVEAQPIQAYARDATGANKWGPSGRVEPSVWAGEVRTGTTGALACSTDDASFAVVTNGLNGYSSKDVTLFIAGCDAGRYGDWMSSTTCQQCNPGTYAPIAANSACFACSPGTTQSLPGQGSCQDCQAGFYCPNSTMTQMGVPCPAGTYNPQTGASSPAACTPCPVGYYSVQQGQTSFNTCVPCGAGRANPNPGASNPNACALCAAGTYTNSTTSSVCYSCPPGTYNGTQGAHDFQSTCAACPPGKYAANSGSSSCTNCAADELCVGATIAPLSLASVGGAAALTTGANTGGRESLPDRIAAYNSVSFNVILVMLGPSAVIAFLICLLFFCIGLCCKVRVIRNLLKKLDLFFGTAHEVPDGSPVLNKKTTSGGLFTIMFFLGLVALLLSLAVQYVYFNDAVTESMKPGSISGFNGTDVWGRVRFHGYGDACSRNGFTFVFNGVSSRNISITVAYSPATASCDVSWMCQSCLMQTTNPTFLITSTEPSASAVLISYEVSSTQIVNFETNVIYGTVAAPSNLLFRGQFGASTAVIGIVPTRFDYYSQPTRAGYRLYDGSVTAGLAVPPQQMYQHRDVAFMLQFQLFTGYAAVTVGPSLTLSVYASQFTSFASTILSVLGIALGFWEKIVARIAARLRANRSKNTVVPVSSAELTSMAEAQKGPMGHLAGKKDDEDDDKPMDIGHLEYKALCREVLRLQQAVARLESGSQYGYTEGLSAESSSAALFVDKSAEDRPRSAYMVSSPLPAAPVIAVPMPGRPSPADRAAYGSASEAGSGGGDYLSAPSAGRAASTAAPSGPAAAAPRSASRVLFVADVPGATDYGGSR